MLEGDPLTPEELAETVAELREGVLRTEVPIEVHEGASRTSRPR
ncbi:MAG: hypothetical protein N3H32_02580 [Nitrososphaeria archaeon]|nr:hypothetical protein [Nitrososphaeria archaeon]MDW8043992.1 hypothetical protein [Nitrososphaerota archaeon]